MSSFYAWVHVESARLGGAFRQYWRRIIAGAFCGWVASSLLGAFGIVWLEQQGVVASEGTVGIVGAAIVWSGMGLGAIVAYAMRQAPETERT